MFTVTYKMQMPSGILMFEIDLMVTELKEGEACNALGPEERCSC